MPAPPAPVVAGALSGFAVGVLLTLLATGTLSHGTPLTSAPPTASPPILVSDHDLLQRIEHLVSPIVGPLPSDPKRSRLLRTQIYPVTASDVDPGNVGLYSSYRSVHIVIRLNDHPFGRVWRLRAAKADVFRVMRALYTSPLYIYDVQLDGEFPMLKNQPNRLQTAMRVYLAHDAAAALPLRRWGRADEGRLWKMLTSTWVDPRFG